MSGVGDVISGLLELNPLLSCIREHNVVYRNDWSKDKVCLVSGGGSGHEPSHSGFVGQHLITAAVCGEVFASPSVEAVLSAIRKLCGDAGCLLIVKNYTGDRLNFGLAMELARKEGYKVQMIIVADDISLDIKEKRGIAGTLFVHRIAGWMAEKGESLERIHEVVNSVQIRSLGVSFSDCHGVEKEEGQVEIGMGIHGERGFESVKFEGMKTLVEKMLDKLFDKQEKGEFVLLLNNLGSMSNLELMEITHLVFEDPRSKQISYFWDNAGCYMSALRMRGFSFSLLRLQDESIAKALFKPRRTKAKYDEETEKAVIRPNNSKTETDPLMLKCVKLICKRLIENKTLLNDLDEKVGDGDTGSTLAMACEKILEEVDDEKDDHVFSVISHVFRETGGSIGVLLSVFFTKLEMEEDWKMQGLRKGLDQMKYIGGAQQGLGFVI